MATVFDPESQIREYRKEIARLQRLIRQLEFVKQSRREPTKWTYERKKDDWSEVIW